MKYRLGILLAVCLVVLPVSSHAQTEDGTRIFNQSGPGTVALVVFGENKAEIARGTAFGITEDIVATAYHLVSRGFDAEVTTIKGKKYKVDGIVAFSRPGDVALLKIKGKVTPLAMGGQEALAAGARVFGVGANETGLLIPSEGTIRSYLDLGASGKFMDVSLTMPNAFCGAPVMDINGRVEGMVAVLDARLRCVIPLAAFKDLARGGKVTALKDWAHEDYFGTFDGAFLAGRLGAALDELGSAKAYLETAVKLNPSYADAYASLGAVYTSQRDYNGAAGAIQKVIELAPDRTDAYQRLGSLYLKMQRFADAIPPLEKAAAADSTRKETLYELATAYEENKDFSKAAEAYQRYLAAKPENAWSGQLRLGICWMQLSQFEAAALAFEEARKLQPNDVKTNFSLAEAYMKARQLDKAEETYKSLAGINPDGATTYYGKIIQMYDEAGQYDKAVEAARKVIEVNPKNELAVFNLGIMYMKLQKYDEAVQAFRDALVLKPDYASALYNIGYSYSLAKKWKESVEGFQKYSELTPQDPLGYLNIGVGYMMLKNFEKALEPLRKCIELKPDNAVAYYNLAIVYLNLKDSYSAKEVYKTLLNLNPDYAAKLKKLLK
jgi:tetratricopeptide (TPR) repeat protein